MNAKSLLELLHRGETLDSGTLEGLIEAGGIKASSITNMNPPPAQKDFLFIYITEKGKRVLET